MNTELRNKLFNKIKNVFENEDTQEREAYLQARETVDQQYTMAEEIKKCLAKNMTPISLGESRLRTETAALVAVNTISFIN